MEKVLPLVTLGKSLHFGTFRGSSPQCLPLINIYPWDFEDPKQGEPEGTEEVRGLHRRDRQI